MNKIIIGVWAASLGVAFYSGTFNSSISLDQNEILRSNSEMSKVNSNSAKNVSSQNEAQNQLRISTSLKVRRPIGDVFIELNNLLENPMTANSYSGEYFELLKLVKDLNEEELVELLEMMDIEKIDNSNQKPLLLLLSRYAECNPQNALFFYESNITSQQLKESALKVILSQWSHDDPESAYEWLKKSSEDKPFDSPDLAIIFENLARHDLASTIEKLQETSGKYASIGLSSALKTKEDFIDFFEHAKDLNNEKANHLVSQKWGKKNPEEAVEWLGTLDKDDRGKYEYHVLHGWMSHNPVDAANWYFEVSEDKQEAAISIMTSWETDIETKIEWLEKQEGINTSRAIAVSFVLNNDLDYGVKNLDKIPGEFHKEFYSNWVYTSLKDDVDQATQKAAEFLESSPYKEMIEEREINR